MINLPNINCDLGEGHSLDHEFMKYITACNIACGGHYGDENSIRETVELAQKNGVFIGAHPSYPDKDNFGRKTIDILNQDLQDSIKEQIISVKEICDELEVDLHHVKLHGALYNDVWGNEELSLIIIEALKSLDFGFSIYAPENSTFAKLCNSDFEVIHEAFIDRKYDNSGRLTPRTLEGSVLTSNEECWAQFHSLWKDGICKSISGDIVEIKADTFCIHSDSSGALKNLKYISNKLRNV